MSGRTGIGVIGCGGIATAAHLPAVVALETKVRLVGVCDIDTDTARRVGEQFGCTWHTDLASFLKLEGLEAVIVATPNCEHCSTVLAAIESGCHVLCEKPLGINGDEAARMCAAAEAAGKTLQVGFQLRFGSAPSALKELVDAGELGQIYFARAIALRRRGVPAWGNFIDREKQGGGPLIDIGVHVLDLALWYMGHPHIDAVSGMTWNLLGKNPDLSNPWGEYDRGRFTIEDMAAGLIRCHGGAAISIESSFMANIKDNLFELHLFGDRAGAVLRPTHATMPLEVFGEHNQKLIDRMPELGTGKEDLHLSAMDAFIASVSRGIPSPVPGEDGLALNRVIDRLYESAGSNVDSI